MKAKKPADKEIEDYCELIRKKDEQIEELAKENERLCCAIQQLSKGYQRPYAFPDPGNALVLRNTLIEISNQTALHDCNLPYSTIHAWASLALRSQARNCDRYETPSNYAVWVWKKENRERLENGGTKISFADWLYAPYNPVGFHLAAPVEEGETK